MSVYRFSALSDGQSISFSPFADVLNFDQTTIAAANAADDECDLRRQTSNDNSGNNLTGTSANDPVAAESGDVTRDSGGIDITTPTPAASAGSR